ncbi:MAG: flagellar basal body rod protein FlgB [Desulfobacterales bacterium]|nr:flagellar basal body rod protein FlgB [Desulfobacterales bacterium]
MPAETLFEGVISSLQKTLNRGSLRHRVLTSNIANIDTPNYKAFEVVMEEARQKNGSSARLLTLVRTEPRHLSGRRDANDGVKIKQSDPSPFNLRADGNTVDLDRTMGKLAENTLLYRTAAQLIKKKFQGLKNVIQGGGK